MKKQSLSKRYESLTRKPSYLSSVRDLMRNTLKVTTPKKWSVINDYEPKGDLHERTRKALESKAF